MPKVKTIQVFKLPNCIQCQMTIKYLRKYNRDFEIYDLSSPENTELLTEVNELIKDNNYKTAPVVVLRGEDSSPLYHWQGFKPYKFEEHADEID